MPRRHRSTSWHASVDKRMTSDYVTDLWKGAANKIATITNSTGCDQFINSSRSVPEPLNRRGRSMTIHAHSFVPAPLVIRRGQNPPCFMPLFLSPEVCYVHRSSDAFVVHRPPACARV